MERPMTFAVPNRLGSGRFGSAAIVAAIHVAAIFGLVAALNQGAIMKELKIIQAAIDAPQDIPREPPPPPPELVKPTPPVAIVPEFTIQKPVAATPSITTVPAKPAAPASAPSSTAISAPPDDPLRPIMSTHTLPPYPPIAKRLNEQGTTLMELAITPRGNVSECKILQSSSSQRLDEAGCDFVTSHWRWQPPTKAGKPVAVRTHVSIKWDLRTSD